MLIEQTHFPKRGPNWGSIALFTFIGVSVILVTYKHINSTKINIDSNINKDNRI